MIHGRPYAELAHIYDAVMDHVHYDTWERYIISLFERYGQTIETVLELACGTGSLLQHLIRDGYRVVGTDISPSMLAIARHKLRSSGYAPKLVAADMAAIPFCCTFDAVICLYDSLNYLCDTARIAGVLSETARVLTPGGLFIFDVCTVRNSQLFFSHHEMSETVGDITYHRTSRYHSSDQIQENEFMIESNGTQIRELHRQRIYRLDTLKELIANAPYEIIGLFDDTSLRPGTEQSERVHFVLRRNPDGEERG